MSTLPLKVPGTSANLKRPFSNAMAPVRRAPERTGEFRARERQGLSADPAAVLERRALVPSARRVEAALSLHREVERVGAGDPAELQVEGKCPVRFEFARVEGDPGQLSLRSGREVAVIDRAALEFERADAPAGGGFGRRVRAGCRLTAEPRPVGGSVWIEDQPHAGVRRRNLVHVRRVEDAGPGNADAQLADRDERRLAEPRRLRDREPPDVDRRRREEAEAEGFDRRGQPGGVLDPPGDHPARKRGAGADPQHGEGRQRDERYDGR
jgi:hypothetical protein